MLENLKLGLIILLTGVVVVFAVLVLLILIIKLYSTAVSSAQSSIEAKKVEKAKADKEEKPAAEEVQAAEKAAAESGDDSIPGEIIAAIAAAVEVIFGQGAASIKSVKRAKPKTKRRSAWKSAGMAENTRVF